MKIVRALRLLFVAAFVYAVFIFAMWITTESMYLLMKGYIDAIVVAGMLLGPFLLADGIVFVAEGLTAFISRRTKL